MRILVLGDLIKLGSFNAWKLPLQAHWKVRLGADPKSQSKPQPEALTSSLRPKMRQPDIFDPPISGLKSHPLMSHKALPLPRVSTPTEEG